jgi:hypothetical protein
MIFDFTRGLSLDFVTKDTGFKPCVRRVGPLADRYFAALQQNERMLID